MSPSPFLIPMERTSLLPTTTHTPSIPVMSPAQSRIVVLAIALFFGFAFMCALWVAYRRISYWRREEAVFATAFAEADGEGKGWCDCEYSYGIDPDCECGGGVEIEIDCGGTDSEVPPETPKWKMQSGETFLEFVKHTQTLPPSSTDKTLVSTPSFKLTKPPHSIPRNRRSDVSMSPSFSPSLSRSSSPRTLPVPPLSSPKSPHISPFQWSSNPFSDPNTTPPPSHPRLLHHTNSLQHNHNDSLCVKSSSNKMRATTPSSSMSPARVAAIVSNPKLAPVQGPMMPLRVHTVPVGVTRGLCINKKSVGKSGGIGRSGTI